ncbi:MAG: hypothetical protein N2D54_04910 [Chloroflexota bacterium]
MDDEFILFNADALVPPFKIGYFNPHGWIAYLLDDILFYKTFDVQTDHIYPDNNCNVEIYGNDQFVELESLAPLTILSPGESVNHIEKWEIFDGIDTFPDEVKKLWRKVSL